MADLQTKKLYEDAAKAKGQPLFSLTVADFFNAPSVDEVDLAGYSGQAGDPIVIHASDDFAVSALNVALTDAEGSPIALRQAQDASRKAARPSIAQPKVGAGSTRRLAQSPRARRCASPSPPQTAPAGRAAVKLKRHSNPLTPHACRL